MDSDEIRDPPLEGHFDDRSSQTLNAMEMDKIGLHGVQDTGEKPFMAAQAFLLLYFRFERNRRYVYGQVSPAQVSLRA
jgi:hypothetical protein